MAEPIVFFDRYKQQLETEVVYGEGFLRWAYEHAVGRVATQVLVKRACFSQWYGWRMNQAKSRGLIAPFIERYGIDVGEMKRSPGEFEHFNAFFARELNAGARPVDAASDAVVFPADGRHFVIPDIAENDGIFVKGTRFNLLELLGDKTLAKRFAHGSMLISRLCPVDYHRFHFPWEGIPGEPRLIGGDLYSVSPIALRRRQSLLWENKRYVTRLQTDLLGEVLLLDVGATCVGTVVSTFEPGKHVVKGDEKGYFLFGGSCVITIFEPGRVVFEADLLEQSSQRKEVYARIGDRAATVVEVG
ncbi:phosphatidylserine decarboxylase [Phragmitibacter flavus]|uniref:Phosphatidylserine decarboxylase n=1 Tax=Phragmitibacter flavus TaxID=2576071 RepID=A0A5R8KH75_9BACT|nr:phosphatidylserine decarboxylase [Phragmitibacter flavus]TLD71632.1 phosphatidylserine decarboxylase [Phragmitibacter flavus]